MVVTSIIITFVNKIAKLVALSIFAYYRFSREIYENKTLKGSTYR